ncbi:DUF6415 family natural product biosynthesis protein [Streptomyces sp. NPDC053560]|uniref:DUF6415 family natural product biosynthesis protein n=1 Tax=Streptomyces sp. NPDC053560 TaxID=3365711 RepID=UPI0037CD929E
MTDIADNLSSTSPAPAPYPAHPMAIKIPDEEREPTDADALAKLGGKLRARITALLPEVRAQFSDLLTGTLEWDRTFSVLDRIADRAKQPPAATRQGQIVQLDQLRRDYSWLLDQLPGAER